MVLKLSYIFKINDCLLNRRDIIRTMKIAACFWLLFGFFVDRTVHIYADGKFTLPMHGKLARGTVVRLISVTLSQYPYCLRMEMIVCAQAICVHEQFVYTYVWVSGSGYIMMVVHPGVGSYERLSFCGRTGCGCGVSGNC